MRVCVAASSKLSVAMSRIAEALARYAPPEIQIVPNESTAELVVLHVIGHPETVAAVDSMKATGQRYAIMQYCLRTTQEPSTHEWLSIWRGAECVWSYYDLAAAMVEDGLPAPGSPITGNGPGDLEIYLVDKAAERFYHAPLGVDTNVFTEMFAVGQRYAILTSGYVAESECVGECLEAARRVGRRAFHLGPRSEIGPVAGDHVDFGLGISDVHLARTYGRCDFVAGMRRGEGFEMPAAEGLLCGARPIMLDAPHYRAWFDEFAVFVPEADPATVTDAVEEILRGGPRPVSDDELAAAAERFNWEKLVTEFWSRVLERST